MNYSPLRYPGGKRKLSAFIAKICIDNKISGHYIEPYSGGSSVALFLLMEGFVERVLVESHVLGHHVPTEWKQGEGVMTSCLAVRRHDAHRHQKAMGLRFHLQVGEQ